MNYTLVDDGKIIAVFDNNAKACEFITERMCRWNIIPKIHEITEEQYNTIVDNIITEDMKFAKDYAHTIVKSNKERAFEIIFAKKVDLVLLIDNFHSLDQTPKLYNSLTPKDNELTVGEYDTLINAIKEVKR